MVFFSILDILMNNGDNNDIIYSIIIIIISILSNIFFSVIFIKGKLFPYILKSIISVFR